MKVEYNKEMDTFTVILSRRNVLSLLHKSDQEWSNKMITRQGDPLNLETEPHLAVRVETDEDHYRDRGYGPGPAHAETEAFVAEHMDKICQKCEGETNEPHTCPYDDDVHSGTGKLCNCCDNCSGACAQEI